MVPSKCQSLITYSCVILVGSRLDLCSIDEGSSQSSFDASSGVLTLSTIDMENIGPGVYTMQIIGSVGSINSQTTVDITLTNPCSSV